jgi:uncharacterized protein YyaL (SSP411 family)
MESSKAPQFRFSPRPNRASEIQWRSWGPQPFEEARRDDKLVLLAISAVWCHWCHVMDETTYSDPQVIEAINRNFIPIRVDNDRQPEVNRRYNQGGWPTTAFLLPSGEVLTGATYVPPQQMVSLLDRVLQYYTQRRTEIEAKLQEMKTQREAASQAKAPQTRLSWQLIEEIDNALLNSYDWVYGGFGDEPKFPHTDALEYALTRLHQSGDESWRKLLRTTLEAMSLGGMFDHVEGGFFRYSTRRDWSVPHFEKMLEDNSSLLRIYVWAADLLQHSKLMDVAHSVAQYLRSVLFQESTGAFSGSQDADEEYYTLNTRETRRSTRAPYVDPTVYADWNAMAVRSLIAYYVATGHSEWWNMAQRTIEFIVSRMFHPGQGVCHYWDGKPSAISNLADQIHVAHALLDSYQAGGTEEHYALARELLSIIQNRFAAPEGGFYDVIPDPAAPGYLSLPDRPLPENALIAELALRFSLLTDDQAMLTMARDILSGLAVQAPRYGIFAAQFGRVVHRFLTAATHVVVVGHREGRLRLVQAAHRPFHSNREVEPLGPDLRPERISARGYLPDMAAYVCIGTLCLEPTDEPSQLEERVRQAVPHPLEPGPAPEQEL